MLCEPGEPLDYSAVWDIVEGTSVINARSIKSKKVDEYSLCETFEKLVQRQTIDNELAVANCGPYKICDYNDLLISEDKWVKMTPLQCATGIAKVHSISSLESNVKESLTTSTVRHQQT